MKGTRLLFEFRTLWSGLSVFVRFPSRFWATIQSRYTTVFQFWMVLIAILVWQFKIWTIWIPYHSTSGQLQTSIQMVILLAEDDFTQILSNESILKTSTRPEKTQCDTECQHYHVDCQKYIGIILLSSKWLSDKRHIFKCLFLKMRQTKKKMAVCLSQAQIQDQSTKQAFWG